MTASRLSSSLIVCRVVVGYAQEERGEGGDGVLFFFSLSLSPLCLSIGNSLLLLCWPFAVVIEQSGKAGENS